MSYEPCENRSCKSYGKPHPNCRCFAAGGAVCSGPHKSDCEYFADGGEVQSQPANPDVEIAHAAIHHGLLGMLKNVGHSSMANPEKHERILHDAKNHHEPRGEGQNKTMGHRLGEHLSGNKHEDAAELMQGHPLVGSGGKGNLKKVMERMGPAIMRHEPNPEALRGASDYLHGALKGNDELGLHTMQLFDKQKSADRIKPDEKSREQLKERLQQLEENPELALEVGGKVGHYLPDHASAFGMLTANALNYFSGLKPAPSTTRPFDRETPPDIMAQQQYDRQLDIAQNPKLVLQHVKDGTLRGQDMITLRTLFPALQKSLSDKAMEALVDAKMKDVEIPYHQKQSLSVLLGEPLDSTMTPENMQAIIKSAAIQQAQQKQGAQPAGKATAVEMGAIDKVDKLERTTLEARQINRTK